MYIVSDVNMNLILFIIIQNRFYVESVNRIDIFYMHILWFVFQVGGPNIIMALLCAWVIALIIVYIVIYESHCTSYYVGKTANP